MPTEQILSGDYFDTPARAERLQLLLHLVRNAGEVIYLRGPAGAGKTRFVQRLFDILGDETSIVWVRASSDCDVPAVVVDQLGLAPDDISPWPDAVLNWISGRDLLVIVDDADRLGLEAIESLANLHARGGRLLLVGQGGLAQTSGNWDVQFVDLPPFDAEQTVAFLRGQAGDQAARVTDDLAAGLHRAANGTPGLLLDALNGVLASRRSAPRVPEPAIRAPDAYKRPVWHWVTGGLVLAVLVAVLQFQDQINAVFVSEDGLEQGPPPDRVAVEPISVVKPVQRTPEPAPADSLRDEAVSALMPEIALPELSREPTASGATSADPAVEPSEAPAEVTAEPPAADGGSDEDPLDAVMRDALAAAEKEKTVEPVAAVAPETADKAADSEQVTSADKPVDDPAAVPVAVKQVPQKTPAVAVQKPEPVVKAPAPQVTQAVPAPVESRQAAPVERPSMAESPPAKVVSSRVPVDGTDWMKSRTPGHYTLQLVGARDRNAVQKFVRDYGIDKPYAIFERDLKGKPWYSLVAGDYPDRDAAISARARLPKSLERSGVWPRTFESIRESLK